MPKRTRNESPQKQTMREMMKDYLKNNDVHIKDGKCCTWPQWTSQKSGQATGRIGV